jgi:hypothetical protein
MIVTSGYHPVTTRGMSPGHFQPFPANVATNRGPRSIDQQDLRATCSCPSRREVPVRPRLGRLASAVPLAELGSPQAAGQLSAVLFFLCGLLVAVTSPLMPAGPHVHPLVLAGIGLTAAASGVVIMALPWRRRVPRRCG